MFKQIHEIVFHGRGGYDYMTVYNMPIWLRNYTFKTMEEYFVKQNQEQENRSNPNQEKTVVPLPKDITYKTKARK